MIDDSTVIAVFMAWLAVGALVYFLIGVLTDFSPRALPIATAVLVAVTLAGASLTLVVMS